MRHPPPSLSAPSFLRPVKTWLRRWSICACLTPFLTFPGLQGQSAPDLLAQHYQAAQESLRNGDRETAAKEYEAFLGEAIHRVGNARAHIGELSEAAECFDQALAFVGQDTAVRLDYASVLFDQSRTKEAESLAQSVVDAEPRNSRALVLLGRINFEQKDYSSARLHFEAALANGDITQIWRLLSITDLRLRDLVSARSLLRRTITAIGDTTENEVAVAMIYYYGDYPDQAIEELKAVIAKNPDAPAAHYSLGLAYLADNEEAGYPKAIPEFQAQLRIDPNDFPSHYMLGYIQLKERNFDSAERELKRAAALNPADRGSQLLLGQLYSETNRISLAQEALRKLIASFNDVAPSYELVRAHYILGRTLQESGRSEEGANEIRESERLRKQIRMTLSEVSGSRVQPLYSPSNDIATAGSSSHQSQARVTDEDKAQADEFIRQISPAIAEGYYNLGGIARGRQDSATADQFMRKAIQWDPSLAKPNQ